MVGTSCSQQEQKEGVSEMAILKIIVKILLFPVVAALTVIQWAGIFLNSISGVILGILAFIFALTGIASLTFGLVSGPEALKMIAAGFVIFMVPAIGGWFVTMIASLNTSLRDFIRS